MVYSYARPQGGVNTPGKYALEFSVLDCFNDRNYKEGFKGDSIKSNYILKGQRIWRTISLENKNNITILQSGGRCTNVGLLEVIKFGLMEKKLNAFSSDDFSNTFLTPLAAGEIRKSLMYYDSSVVSNFNADGDQKQETIITRRYLVSSDIKSYLVKEDWILNSYTGLNEKHIIAIAPLIYSEKEQKITALFWLYYPEWKNLFSCFEAKNLYSNEMLSFDDIFNKRYFISRISKVNNLYDRPLKSINHGEDAYLESERVKEKLDQAENDLFQY